MMMYQEHGDFEQTSSIHGQGGPTFSQPNFPTDDQTYPQNAAAVAAASALEMELQHHLELEQCYGAATKSACWEETATAGFNQTSSSAHFNHILAATASTADAAAAAFTAPDLLSMFPLPRCSPPSLLPNGGVYDPLLPLNLPPQPPLLRDLFHSLPNGTGLFGGPRSNGSLFGNDADEREGNFAIYQNGDGGGVYEFNAGAGAGSSRDGNKDMKHYATEKHRRVLLNDKYKDLRSLIPNPTKNDRASVVGDAINYINELKRTVDELQGLVEKKRFAREKLKRPKVEGNIIDPYNGSSSLRSSWLHRKSKNTEVDVRIIDDEVTVKLVQQKRINCLLFVSRVLDELQLDLHHVAGGVVGDYYSYLFNSKISEGSIVYASAVASKLIDIVDKQYAAAAASNY